MIPALDAEPLGALKMNMVEGLKLSLMTSGSVLKQSSSSPVQRQLVLGPTNDPLQYSCLDNPMDREARWATVHGVTVSQLQLSIHVLDVNDYGLITARNVTSQKPVSSYTK